MFGADTPLVMDALQMVAIAVALTAAGTFAIMRRRKRADTALHEEERQPGRLEERVRVLERIATDQSIGLADDIEALRDHPKTAEGQA